MADEHLPLVEPIRPPWREQLTEALLHVQRDVLLVGPYIKDDVIATLKDTLAERLNPQPLAIRIITRVLPDDFLSGASDIAALQHLLTWPDELTDLSVEIRAINNVHAKVWVFDTNMAIVGSGNATFPGLETNLEYGLAISEHQLVEQILHDWQEWWEQASPVHVNELQQLSLWLEAIASDVETRKAEKVAQEKRQAAERRIGTAPRLGSRLVFVRSERTGKYAISERQNPYGASPPQSDFYAPEVRQGILHTLPEMVHVLASHLWQALRWTTFLADEESQPIAANGTFLKITTRPVSHQQHVLQFTWADGKRFSQATILGYAGDAQPSWTMTLGERAVRQLVDYMQHLSGEIMFDGQQPTEPELLVWWQPSPSRFFVSQASESNDPVVMPCMPAAVPGNTPVLRPPLSQITIEQESLLTGMMTLKHQWEKLHPDATTLTTVEISFDSSGSASTMTLSVGPINNPLFVSIPGTDYILSGPEIRLSLDFISFEHMVNRAQGRIQHWRMRVGLDAEALQFIPEFESHMAWANSLVWFHELRDVAEG